MESQTLRINYMQSRLLTIYCTVLISRKIRSQNGKNQISIKSPIFEWFYKKENIEKLPGCHAPLNRGGGRGGRTYVLRASDI
jgi:hypothetical protein